MVAESKGGPAPIGPNQDVALCGNGALCLSARYPSRLVVLAGPALNQSLFVRGPFIMNDEPGVGAALQRYRAGEMGTLASCDRKS